MRIELDAVASVTSRYVGAFRSVWRQRRQLDVVPRTEGELAFQPAAIELAETPLSPVPRRTMQIIVALFILALVWAAVGKLDIVAVAEGKIVTDSRTKTIQVLENSIVRRIFVSDGQRVKRGDVLLELDAVGVKSDTFRAEDGLRAARLNALRNAAVASSFVSGKVPDLGSPANLSASQLAEAAKLASAEFETFSRKVDSLRAAVGQKEAELHSTEMTLGPAREYAKIAADRVADYERLLGSHYVSRQEYLVRVQEKINAERDVTSQKNKVHELSAAVVVAKEDLASAIVEARRGALDAERQAREQVGQLSEELARAHERGASMRLVSPVDGTVQAIAAHTIGGVVTPAQGLMSIVPAKEGLEAEVDVLNTDIGFVSVGQEVIVKVQSFPYTRYGYLVGHVASISHDAVKDDKLGLVFPGRVSLDSDTIDVDGARVRLSPGMVVSAEVNTGRRTVLNYLLDPLRVQMREGLHER